MRVLYDREEGPRGGVLTMGTFDGVHLGHKALLREARQWARAMSTFIEVWVYHPHPREVLRGERIPLLTLLPERLRLLEAEGVEIVRVISFTPSLAALSAGDFVVEWIQALSAPGRVVLGYDHRFGRGREGDAAFLRAQGLLAEEVPPLLEGGLAVSSSRIRQLIQVGDMEVAAQLLGYPYFVEGTVERGQQVARRLGTPTANIPWPKEKVSPPAGVYAGRVYFFLQGDDGWPALLYLSPQGVLEVHLLGWEGGSLYGERLKVELMAFMRAHREGLSEGALQAQIAEDLLRVQAYWGLA